MTISDLARRFRLPAGLAVVVLLAGGAAQAATLKIATLSPEGSAWMELLRAGGEDDADAPRLPEVTTGGGRVAAGLPHGAVPRGAGGAGGRGGAGGAVGFRVVMDVSCLTSTRGYVYLARPTWS